MKWFFGAISSISVILIVLYVSIHIPTFSIATYTNHYYVNETAQLIQVSEEDLIMVTQRLLGYIRGVYPDLLIYATIGGEVRQFFNQREIDHMEDVLLLFRIGRILLGVSIFAFFLTLFWAYKNRAFQTIAKANFIGGLLVLSYCALLMWLFATNFERHFIIFHEIFFFFDYELTWRLNPSTDLLINMVPEIFFINIFTTVALIFFGAILAITLASFAYIIWGKKELL